MANPKISPTIISDQQVFNLPHVQVDVFVRNTTVALRRDGSPRPLLETEADLQRTLSRRDWRNLCKSLIKLDFNNRVDVAHWLKDAGYVPERNRPIDVAGEDSWHSRHFVWLRKQRDAIAWLMMQDRKQFLKALGAASSFLEDKRDAISVQIDQEYFKDQRRLVLREPEIDFWSCLVPRRRYEDLTGVSLLRKLRKDLEVPPRLRINTLAELLNGAGPAPSLHALFNWTQTGQPRVNVTVETPIQAIALLVHRGMNFGKRRWLRCKRPGCDVMFEQKKATDRFCSKKCKNSAASAEFRMRQKKARRRLR